MFYIPSNNEPPMGRVAMIFWIVGVLAVVPFLSWCLVRLLHHAGVLDASSRNIGIWIGLGSWAVGNVVWMAMAYVLDAWDAGRCEQRRPDGRVLLRWRNRLLVDRPWSRPRLVGWCCVAMGIRIILYPALAGLCLFAAYGFASIEDGPNSTGPAPLVGLCFLVIAIGLLAATVHGLWQRARLVRHGRLVTGTVTGAGLRSSGGVSSRLAVEYRYRTPAGEEQVGAEHLSYRPRRIPSAGDELVVLYDEKVGARVL